MKMRNTAPLATFTFDDFPASAYTVAGRLLERADARATYFASAEFLGRTVNGLSHYDAAMLADIHAAGHEIGCHSHDHVSLPTRGAAFATDSSRRNAEAMKEVLGSDFTMTSFAYPYGDVSLRVKRAMKRMYSVCRGVRQQLNRGYVDLAQVGVVSLEARHWVAARMAQTIAEAVRTNAWMVFLTHDVSDDPTPYGSTPDMLQATLRLVQEAGVSILPMKSAVAHCAFGEGQYRAAA